MRIRRHESWGYLIYDTGTHDFELERSPQRSNVVPYTNKPIVLCAYLSFACNMRCRHCVVRDFGIPDNAGSLDLYDKKLISVINRSSFLVVDITGGEPLLPELEPNLIHVLSQLNGKGLLLDTNGTCFPSQSVLGLLRSKKVLVRVSWDSLNPNQEAKLRCFPNGLFTSNEHYLQSKIAMIQRLSDAGVTVAVQTVLSGVNRTDTKVLKEFPSVLASLGINKWYLQRYIPSHKVKTQTQYSIGFREYESLTVTLDNICREYDIRCYSKRDMRHNSVFLLTQDGRLFTQDDVVPGRKLLLGNLMELSERNSFFEEVSASDHSDRYYAKHGLLKGDVK
jgi:MoaA/NifB/PqqE/SkfB family radical SAM enzyme